MKTAHTAVVAAALVMVPVVAWNGSGFDIESPKAQTTDSAASRPPAPEQNRRLVPRVEDMVIQLELEPAKAMPTVTGSPPKVTKHDVGEGELYHVKVIPIDPRSKKRIPYTSVIFQAFNKDNGREVKAELQPMWNHNGLHYAFNSGLGGDGAYESKVIVGVPTFARDPNDPDRWMQPVVAKFHFSLAGGKLTEMSEIME